MFKITISLSIFTSSLLFSFSTNIPNIGDSIRQTNQKEKSIEKINIPNFDITNIDNNDSLNDDSKIFIKSFKIEGNKVMSTHKIQSMIFSYSNKELSMKDIKNITSIITKIYRDKGYFVAKAFVPVQQMEDGMLKIKIIEGEYNNIILKNNSKISDKEISKYFNSLKEKKVINSNDLEHQILLLNELSGIEVSGTEISPGDKTGTSDITIKTSETQKYTGYINIDNYGSLYTGENRLGLMGKINNLTGIGDSIVLNGLISDSKNLNNAKISYETPFGYSGLNGGVSSSITKYNISEIPEFEGYGKSNEFNLFLNYSIINSFNNQLKTGITYSHKILKDTNGLINLTETSEKKIDSISFHINSNKFRSLLGKKYQISLNSELTLGKLNLKNETAINNDININSKGRYGKLTTDFSYNQSINNYFNIVAKINGQKSFGKNLNSTEDISITGSNGIRSYEESELSGDQGILFSFEGFCSLPSFFSINHNFSLFYDKGKVWKNSTIFNTEKNERILSDIGVSYSLNYKNIGFKTSFSHGFGLDSIPNSESEITTSSNKFLIQGNYKF